MSSSYFWQSALNCFNIKKYCSTHTHTNSWSFGPSLSTFYSNVLNEIRSVILFLSHGISRISSKNVTYMKHSRDSVLLNSVYYILIIFMQIHIDLEIFTQFQATPNLPAIFRWDLNVISLLLPATNRIISSNKRPVYMFLLTISQCIINHNIICVFGACLWNVLSAYIQKCCCMVIFSLLCRLQGSCCHPRRLQKH